MTSNALVREYIYSANSLHFILTETDNAVNKNSYKRERGREREVTSQNQSK